MKTQWFVKAVLVVSVLLLGAGVLNRPASAALVEFQNFVGHVGLSTDGFGSLSNTGTISAEIPGGSTVLAAYLYSSTFFTSGTPSVSLHGMSVTFGPRVVNTHIPLLASVRADVTSIVKPVIDTGPGGIYNFLITETSLGANTDGEALVVVFENPLLPEATVGILDGFASVTGETTTINFAAPLDPTNPGFFADMRLGIGFSCCSQRSTVEVNGALLTENAGDMDDADAQSPANGRLITVGGFNDPFAPLLPSYADDHERYDVRPFITVGDTSITVETSNTSQNDNIFLATFHVAGMAGINAPPPAQQPVPHPEPSTIGLMGTGILGLWWSTRRQRKRRMSKRS